MAQTGWHAPEWTSRQKIPIDSQTTGSGPYELSGDLTDFAFLISITNAANDIIGVAQSDGDDILFTDADGVTKLSHEIDYYDDSSGTDNLATWVKLPTFRTDTNTVIYMYYGNPNVVSQEQPELVWDDGYDGVWHLHDDLDDSTANANNGTNSGTTDTTGKIGNGRYFNPAESDRINVASSASLQISSEITVSLWTRSTLDGNWRTLMKYI